MKLIHQLRELAANKDVSFVGANLKFDLHMMVALGIEVANWKHDTMQLAFVVDDNMQNKGLDECVRRWLVSYAGYADHFNATVDKGAMQKVPHDDMLTYSVTDADVTRQLCFKLVKLAKEDPRNYNCYTRVQMPALRAFFRMEREGLQVDTDALGALARVASRQEHELYQSLIARVPGAIKRKHLEDPKLRSKPPEKILSFGRANFVIDILFDHPDGYKLTPKVFTKTTARMAPEDRIPSTSAKDHLPFFADRMDAAGDFIRDLMDYTKLQKMRTTYIGVDEHSICHKVSPLKNGKRYPKRVQEALEGAGVEFEVKPPSEEEAPTSARERVDLPGGDSLIVDHTGRPWVQEEVDATGFWKYLSPTESIHSSFMMHRTVTGRSSSADPNLQNVPKRGTTVKMEELVHAYRKVMVARPGHVFVSADLSQAELRLVAWMAGDPTMLRVYRDGGDIHAMTAAKTMGLSLEEFMELPKDQRKMGRFRSKAINFGFCHIYMANVLTRHGTATTLKPIHEVTTADLVWDGHEWVSHDGLIDQGTRKCIWYDGYAGTPDHKCFISDREKTTLLDAAQSGLPLLHTGQGDSPLRKGEWTTSSGGRFPATPKRAHLNVLDRVRRVWGVAVAHAANLKERWGVLVPGDGPGHQEPPQADAGASLRFHGAEMRTGYACAVSQLQGQGHQVPVPEPSIVHSVGSGDLAGRGLQREGLRQDRQRRALRAKQSAAGNTQGKLAEQAGYSQDTVSGGRNSVGRVFRKVVSVCRQAHLRLREAGHDRGRHCAEGDRLRSEPHRKVGQGVEADGGAPSAGDVGGGSSEARSAVGGELCYPAGLFGCNWLRILKDVCRAVGFIQDWRGDSTPVQAAYVFWKKVRKAEVHVGPNGLWMDLGGQQTYDIMNAGPRRRFTCNDVLVSNCYGMWWKKFRSYAKTDYNLDLTDHEAEQLREDFFDLYSGLEDWHWGMKDFAKEHEYVRSLHGALRRLPAVRSSDEGVMKEAQRQGINSPIQRMASDIGLIGMTRFAQACPWERMHPILFIHDDVVVEAREEDAEEAASALRWFMQTPPLWEWFNIESPIPLVSDVCIGNSLADLEEVDIDAAEPEWAYDENLRLYI